MCSDPQAKLYMSPPTQLLFNYLFSVRQRAREESYGVPLEAGLRKRLVGIVD